MRSDTEIVGLMAADIHAKNCNARHWIGTVGAAEGYPSAQCHCAEEALKLFTKVKNLEGGK